MTQASRGDKIRNYITPKSTVFIETIRTESSVIISATDDCAFPLTSVFIFSSLSLRVRFYSFFPGCLQLLYNYDHELHKLGLTCKCERWPPSKLEYSADAIVYYSSYGTGDLFHRDWSRCCISTSCFSFRDFRS